MFDGYSGATADGFTLPDAGQIPGAKIFPSGIARRLYYEGFSLACPNSFFYGN